MPHFSSPGTLEHVANWTAWLGKFKGIRANGLEIGAFEGRATIWFLDNILTHSDSVMHVVDTFEGAEDHHAAGIDCSVIRSNFQNNLAPYQDRIEVYVGRSDDRLPELLCLSPDRFDFIYVDASHRAADVFVDMAFSWTLLNQGGVMICDDYSWSFQGPLSEPKMAIDAFLACFEGKYKLLGKGWQVAIEKL